MADTIDRNVDQLIDAIRDAAGAVSGRLVTFLTVGSYVALTVASTTDRHLLLGSEVELPLLNTKLPVSGWSGFFGVAPWLVIALHAAYLFQLSVLGAKMRQLDARLALLASTGSLSNDERAFIRDRLPAMPYVQFFASVPTSRLNTIIAGLIVGTSTIVFPLALLCGIQFRFLPVHDPLVTWLHRFALWGDVGLIGLFLWTPLRMRDHQRDQQAHVDGRSRIVATRGLVAAACATFVAFSFVASIPGDEPGTGPWFARRNLDLREEVLTPNLSAALVNALTDGDVKRRDEELNKVSRQTFLEGRDLRHANLFHAVLPRFDLRAHTTGDSRLETKLTGAHLEYALMQEVLLDDADLARASLMGAQLQGSRLERANLAASDLSGAQLQDAKLSRARLDGARLAEAQFQGADLSGAVLKGASLQGADLQGAILRNADLNDADLTGADLRGADLSHARFDDAQLRSAKLKWALLDGATFSNAGLVDVDGAPDVVVKPVAADDEAAARDLVANLVTLACGDPYVARGVAARGLSSSDPHRRLLVAQLARSIEQHDECRGMALLPETTKTALSDANDDGKTAPQTGQQLVTSAAPDAVAVGTSAGARGGNGK